MRDAMKAVGVIVGYRRGPGTQNPNQALGRIEGVKGWDVLKFMNAKVVYRDKYGNEYVGRVIRHHGLNGVVRVRFNPNVPGQSLGKKVEIFLEEATERKQVPG